tara:strand:+ start:14 stop:1483 length:1470 start_codon:yes stop_codon:yes gene_type:complete
MAVLEFEQKPISTSSKAPVITNWTPIIGYMLERTTSIAALFYYKLVLEVRLNSASGTILGVIKQRRNGYSDDITNNKARAFFDLREIVNTQLVNTVFDQNATTLPFKSIHTLGANEDATHIFSANGDSATSYTQIASIYVKGYENYSSAANASPANVTTNAINHTLYYLQATLPLFTPRSTTAAVVQSGAFNVFNMSNDTNRFLSDLELDSAPYGLGSVYRNYVQETDYHTIAFLNDETNFDSENKFIVIAYYDSSGSIIGVPLSIPNTSTNGGLAPDDAGLTDKTRLLYFGCGPANLQASDVVPSGQSAGDAKPSNFSNWAFYIIQAYSGSASKSAVYHFIKQDGSCKGFKVRRLAWRNSVGGYDYWNFDMKSTQTLSVERNNYNALIGTYNESIWSYNDTQRGKATSKTTATLKEILNTDWLSEAEARLMEKLLMSTDVYIIENSDTEFTQAVMITDSSIVKKTVANDKLIQYTINIEYANPINTNS